MDRLISNWKHRSVFVVTILILTIACRQTNYTKYIRAEEFIKKFDTSDHTVQGLNFRVEVILYLNDKFWDDLYEIDSVYLSGLNRQEMQIIDTTAIMLTSEYSSIAEVIDSSDPSFYEFLDSSFGVKHNELHIWDNSVITHENKAFLIFIDSEGFEYALVLELVDSNILIVGIAYIVVS